METTKKGSKHSNYKIKNLFISLFDSKADRKTKWVVLGILLYIVSPIDLIPDFIPAIGYADDIILPILLFIAERMLNSKNDKQEEITTKQKNL
ncbi:DUF1232 domain-containing protein [Jeotgalibaca sp. MA1X17-3]|uniref:YkvA family protein n=1 Tax=Jeotgalibaca sp. MA1X17-3 TaxID=2908211 RepID=UPI001F1F20CC|nr:YkvA family protein [Jeotgalibaca sp. MA1X17-3]UJF16336.1 DUF1232 domain-containing protein [Jeotgalibaca sp. MA1X17-3]